VSRASRARDGLYLTTGLLILAIVIVAVVIWLQPPRLEREPGRERLASAARPAGPAGTQRDDYFEADVYFATDREYDGAKNSFRGVRSEQGDVSYGRVTVSIPKDHQRGHIEKPPVYQLTNRNDPTLFVLVMGVHRFAGEDVFKRSVRDLLSEPGRENDVLLFIHGYNTNFKEAAQRTAQLSFDLDFPGAPMFFSWPSRGGFARYLIDDASIDKSKDTFEDFLMTVLQDLGARNVHVIAHSMGNRVLMEALSRVAKKKLAPGSARLKQVILAAPDIRTEDFQELAAAFNGTADRITLYASDTDKAIIASQLAHWGERAGGSPVVVVPGVDTIDASKVRTSFLGHAYFASSILPDLRAVFEGLAPGSTGRSGLGELPEDGSSLRRFLLSSRTNEDGASYWEYVPVPQ